MYNMNAIFNGVRGKWAFVHEKYTVNTLFWSNQKISFIYTGQWAILFLLLIFLTKNVLNGLINYHKFLYDSRTDCSCHLYEMRYEVLQIQSWFTADLENTIVCVCFLG